MVASRSQFITGQMAKDDCVSSGENVLVLGKVRNVFCNFNDSVFVSSRILSKGGPTGGAQGARAPPYPKIYVYIYSIIIRIW